MRPYLIKAAKVLSGVLLVGLMLSFTYVNHREIRILSVEIGSNKYQVEDLLGKGKEYEINKPCQLCSNKDQQYVYNGNPSLWFGRFEDKLLICYEDDIACDITRSGL